jgi:hypothetical protein
MLKKINRILNGKYYAEHIMYEKIEIREYAEYYNIV